MGDEDQKTALGIKLSDSGMKLGLAALLGVGGLGLGSVGGMASDILGTQSWQDENVERIQRADEIFEENEELRAQVAKMTELILNGCHTRQQRNHNGPE